MPFTTLKNWLRPSIQQPRRIRQLVDKMFAPLTAVVNYGKDFWDTWHQVYKPTDIDRVDKK